MPRVLLLSNPRSGSCYLQELLNCHPEIEIAEELLNDEFGLIEKPIETVQDILAELHKTFVGFKVFPEQIYGHDIHFGDLLGGIAATHCIVLWRQGILEALVSRRIADANGLWYSTTKTDTIRKIEIDQDDLESYTKQTYSEWEKIGSEWPVDVRPIFVKFEDLIMHPIEQVKRVLAELSCASDHVIFNTPSERQNPAKVENKVLNFKQLSPEYRDGQLDVEKILLKKINISLQIPDELLQYAPDREPCMPAGGWRYRVAEPFLPKISKQNAFDAIQSGSISSAGYWPRELAKRLRSMFRCPVAQPCSNGFTALLLAMQAENIGEGDEVITPTMTMVAVPNAVHYLKATPVFADNAKNSYNPDWKEYEKVSTPKTRAIVVTHTYGVPAVDIEEIAKECRSRGWVLIEDISECVGVTCSTSDGQEKLLGTFGDFAIASLYANKIVHGGDGGFVVAKEVKVGKRLLSIVNHGFTPSYHFVHFEPAPNAKIHGIGAAIASGCLDEVNFIIKHRALLAKLYRAKLENLPVQPMPRCGPNDTPWVFGIQCKSKPERTSLRAFLAKHGIETRDFFFNLHLQPAYHIKGSNPPSLPNAELLGSTGFYLPTYSNMCEEDIEYICKTVRAFFSSVDSIQNESVSSFIKKPKSCVQIQPDGFTIEVRTYRDSGELLSSSSRGHEYIEAVKLGWKAEQTLVNERYDQVQVLLDDMKSCIRRAENTPLAKEMKNFFDKFINYFESQILLEHPLRRPWFSVDLNEKKFQHSTTIHTTTDEETLQLMVWLLEQQRPETIWEIGSWMGHATARIAEVCKSFTPEQRYRIYACDAFRWQSWMEVFIPDGISFQDGKSFLGVFNENLKPFAPNVEAVEWSYDISKLPTVLENQKPQFVFLDITQEDEDLEQIWSLIKQNLIKNETIILFNGLSSTSIPFFTRHAEELKPIAKPHTIAKAFRYVDETDPKSCSKLLKNYEDVENMMRSVLPLKRTLKFHTSPGWDHHHNNLYCKSIDLLRDRLHSDCAEILFIPAIEETLCDEPELFYNNPWIGVIHSVASHPELFYTPDLSRLCSVPCYLAALKNCQGLYTLTTFQAEYLRKHLPKTYTFPIQLLLYPTDTNTSQIGSSLVPKLISKEDNTMELVHIGNFARDFDLFFKVQVPRKFRKVLVAGDESTREVAKRAPTDVTVTGRLSPQEYEDKLRSSVVFLTLKYEGAANTLLLECISRNVPILAPNISSCTEYIGQEYPLLYDPADPQLENILTFQQIQNSINYLEKLDKSKFKMEQFIQNVERGAVLLSIPPAISTEESKISSQPNLALSGTNQFQKYDVTISICSYKRTHHLPKLIDSLWNNQDFTGTYQIIIWNNNDGRNGIVRDHVRKYIEKSSNKRAVELISSTENYYCSIRFALSALMKSDCLLVCDDDIIPGSNFISFFYKAHQRNPKDVLCVRGHQFLPHQLQLDDPSNVWMDYENLRFKDDDQPEQFIHFVHADACLIPKQALQEVTSVTLPDLSFSLVDDYWMSFISSHTFSRKLRKLSISGLHTNPITRTEDSDKPGLALHTRPEVLDARLRLYVHHMLQGWPKWESLDACLKAPEEMKQIKERKQGFWSSKPRLGFNVSSTLDEAGVADLAKTGTKCVRIGAVGVGGSTFFELSGFLTEPEEQLNRLGKTVKLLGAAGIDVIITLERRLACPDIWKLIAKEFVLYENVVGYDIINEPFTKHEENLHWADVEDDKDDDGFSDVLNNYVNILESIREVDKVTYIVLEPTFWGRVHGLTKFPIGHFKKLDSHIVMSVHFYEPMKLTSRIRNKERFSFPCSVPWYDDIKFSEETFWDESAIMDKLAKAKKWADENEVPMFLGEFGICRDIGGASEYLQAVIYACKKVGMTGMAFSYRDPDWEAMNYEFGSDLENCIKISNDENPLMKVMLKGIAEM